LPLHHSSYLFASILFILCHLTQKGNICSTGDNKATALIKTADPDDQTLTSHSRKQVHFFGTHILVTEECTIIGGTIFVPSDDTITPTIPVPTVSIDPNATGMVSHHGANVSIWTADTAIPPIISVTSSSSFVPPTYPAPTSLTFLELIEYFLLHERYLIDFEFRSMQVI
jgi:hypothetical protein